MKAVYCRNSILIILFTCLMPYTTACEPGDNLKELPYKKYMAKGLIYKGLNYQEANYNQICETLDGKIWFAGGDHDGTDRWWRKERYDKPWGFGNTTVCSYDPKTDEVEMAFEMNKASAIYSNLEMPGHGKIHGNIVADSQGNIYTAGYQGLSYNHWQVQSYYPKSYPGAAILKYNTKTGTIEYLGIPCPYGSINSLSFDEKRNTIHGFSAEELCRYWRLNLTTMELKLYETNKERRYSNTLIVDSKGCCYFVNTFRGFTKFDPDSETYTDLDITLPLDTKEGTSMRGFVITSQDVVYGITESGMFWKCDLNFGKVKEFGHILKMPGEISYNPSFALDEAWGRIYFLADTYHNSKIHGNKKILTIFDMKNEKFYYAGLMDIHKTCYGSIVASDHTVYFCVSTWETDRNGNYIKPPQEGYENMYDKTNQKMMRPYLVKYVPPESFDGLADKLSE